MSSLINQRHFQSGMGELVNFAESLLESQTDHHAINKVQNHIGRASWEMQAALGMANGELRSVDNQSMNLVAKKKKMEDEKNGQNQQLTSFRNQLVSYKSSESSSRNMLREAERHLEEMNHKLKEKKQGVEETEFMRNVGVGLLVAGTLINPVFGLVGGSLVVGGCQMALNAAEKAQENAERAVQQRREEYTRCKAETSRLSSLIQNAESDIARTENRIQSITSEQDWLASRQAEIIRIQDVLRKCVNFLGLLAGKVSIAHTLCMDILIYEELENVLEDILQHVYPLMGQGNQGGVMALSSAEIRGLIGKLRSAQENLHALTYGQDYNAISYFA